MMVLSKTRRAERVRLARIGLSASALAAMALPVKLATPAEAKTPGSTYCYYGVCHRVKTIEETRALVGIEEDITASHYDDCSKDRYNPCGLTSSGERFHADRPDNTASPVYPDGTMLLVWSPQTERALVVRVNNAGPYWGDRRLDLSRAAAEKLGFEGAGIANLKVRVIKAPEPEEAVYSENRNYPPVPGDIGVYPSIEQAEKGMVVAMALQASAPSPLAPVTAANVFTPNARSAEPLVAEAPQLFGRRSAKVAARAADTAAQLASLAFGGLTMRSTRPQRAQSTEALATLEQTLWDEKAMHGADEADALPEATSKSAEAKAEETEEPKVAASEPPQAATAEPAEPQKAATAAAVEEPEEAAAKPAAQKVAAAEADDERSAKRVERRAKSEKAHASRSHKARNTGPGRVARSERVYARSRYASSEYAPSWRPAVRERTTEQTFSAGLRAQASSTM